MSRNDNEVSLKQGRPNWTGLSDSSDTFPTEGGFTTLRNGYINLDGTEIITAPGARRSARPYYLDGGEVSGYDGTAGGLSIAGGASTPTLDFGLVSHFLQDTAAVLAYLMRVDSNSNVTDGYYLARLDTNDFTVRYNGAAVGASADGAAFFARLPTSSTQYGSLSNAYKNSNVFPFHGIAQVGDYPCVVANCVSSDNGGPGTDDREHLAVWVGDSVLSFDSPPSDWKCWYSVVSLPFGMERDGQQTNGYLADGGMHMPARRRGVLDVTNDELLIAVPGHGVCHRASIHFKNKNLFSGYNMTMLGMPKAMMYGATAVTSGSGSLVAGTYWVSIAYKRWTTGEIGLAADPVQVTVTAPDNAIQITYWSARTLVPEVSSDYSILLYASARNASDSGILQVVDEATTGINTVTGSVTSTVTILAVNVLDRRYPRLTQHPYGASWIKTVRGLTFGGGLFGSNIFDTETDFEQYAFRGTAGSDEITILAGQAAASGVDGRLLALSRLPNGFAGFEIMVSEGANQVLAGGVQRLDRQIPETSSTSNSNACKWELTVGIPTDAVLGSGGEDTLKVLFPRGMIWNSELGLPGVTPAINRTIVDRIQGRDFIGAARVGQSLLVMTEKETYTLSWGRSPLGEDPVLVDDTFGCIGANSIVEFQNTAAWLSDLGPVFLQGGKIEWIGKRIRDFWKGLKRDSEGLMPHTEGIHDPERKLVIWAVRSDWGSNTTTYASQADDDVKSFYPNDELLIWNYGTNSFSTMRYGEGRWVNCFGRMRHDDGFWRSSFISNIVDVSNMGTSAVAPRHFFDVYSIEDDYVDHADQPTQKTAVQALFETGGTTYFVASSGDFTGVRKGDYAFIRTGDGTLNWHGTVGDVATTNATNDSIEITTPGSGTWATGAIIEIGVMPPMVLKTQKMRVGQFRHHYVIDSVTIRHRLRRPYPDASTFHGWVQVTITNEDGDSVNFHPALPSSVTSADTVARQLSGSQTKLDRGDIRGNDMQVELTFITDGIIHVKDIILETTQA